MATPTTPAEWLPVLAARLDARHTMSTVDSEPSIDKLRQI